MKLSPADSIAEIGASSRRPRVGAFFDLDGTPVDGFTAAVHVGDRIRRRHAGIGELLRVFEAALRYRFGRLEFENLIVRAGNLPCLGQPGAGAAVALFGEARSPGQRERHGLGRQKDLHAVARA